MHGAHRCHWLLNERDGEGQGVSVAHGIGTRRPYAGDKGEIQSRSGSVNNTHHHYGSEMIGLIAFIAAVCYTVGYTAGYLHGIDSHD